MRWRCVVAWASIGARLIRLSLKGLLAKKRASIGRRFGRDARSDPFSRGACPAREPRRRMTSRAAQAPRLNVRIRRIFFLNHQSTITIFPYNLAQHTEVAMRIIALMNQKGGVGKTTTCVNLGAALAELGRKICVIDLDPQAHLTINYGVNLTPEIISLYDVLLGEKTFLEAMHRVDDNIALVP